jgi:UDPglucose 6-dehydrogenase
LTVAAHKIAVVGGWHQASVVSACFADLGHDVTGIADDPETIAGLNAGQPPVYEPGLPDLLRRNLGAGRLRYTTSFADGLRDAEFVFLSIDTPVREGDESDLKPVLDAAERVLALASGPFTLCVTSQVPVGTCKSLSETARRLKPEVKIAVIYVPEFLRLGTAIDTLRHADRFVIGADDPAAADRVARLYQPLGRPMLMTGLNTAEMGKHASNAFLATSISFINEIANLCEVTGADATQVAEIMKLDRRIGSHAFLSAGLGYAGGTLGREIRALHHLGERHQVDTALVDAAQEVNAQRVGRLVKRIRQLLGPLAGQTIAILGLTYKSGTSTLRRSAALDLIDRLLAERAEVRAFDPLARGQELARPAFTLCTDLASAARSASLLVLIAPWPGMTLTELVDCRATMKTPKIMDSGNFLSPQGLLAAGFEYAGVGR